MTPSDPTPGDPTQPDPAAPDMLVFPEPRPPRRVRRRTLLAGLATVAVLAATATGVALASDTPTPSPSGSATARPSPDRPGAPDGTHRQGAPGKRGGFGLRGGGLGGLAGPMGALHGEFVVPKQGGGYQTLVVQHGTVGSVSTSTVTVKSADGYSATYAVSADTLVNAARDGIGSVKKGDDVSLVAAQKSGNDSVLQIVDLTQFKGLRDRLGPGGGRGQGGQGGPDGKGTPPTDAPSPSTGSTGLSSFGV
jgi:hypothetical protein